MLVRMSGRPLRTWGRSPADPSSCILQTPEPTPPCLRKVVNTEGGGARCTRRWRSLPAPGRGDDAAPCSPVAAQLECLNRLLQEKRGLPAPPGRFATPPQGAPPPNEVVVGGGGVGPRRAFNPQVCALSCDAVESGGTAADIGGNPKHPNRGPSDAFGQLWALLRISIGIADLFFPMLDRSGGTPDLWTFRKWSSRSDMCLAYAEHPISCH